MSRFVSASLDLSRLPAPAVVKDIDYEAILAERIASLAAKLRLAGIEWDVGDLETDPLKILEEVDAFRETLDLGAINDAAKAVLLPYAEGADLDVIGVLFGVERLPAELDPRYRRRIALAPEAYSTAGSKGAYEYHALSLTTGVLDVAATSPAAGVARVVVLTDEAPGTPASDAVVSAVRARLLDDTIRPLTDHVVVQAAAPAAFAIAVRITLPAGPDPTVVAALARKALATFAADCRRVGRGVDPSEVSGAAWSPSVRRVETMSPVVGVPADPTRAPLCTGISIDMVVSDD